VCLMGMKAAPNFLLESMLGTALPREKIEITCSSDAGTVVDVVNVVFVRLTIVHRVVCEEATGWAKTP